MGIHHKDGYSASVEGFFVTDEQRIRLAKTNECEIYLAESCQLPAGTEGDLLVIIDGNESSRRVRLPAGVASGQTLVEYEVAAPF
jgi:hypothetical protein